MFVISETRDVSEEKRCERSEYDASYDQSGPFEEAGATASCSFGRNGCCDSCGTGGLGSFATALAALFGDCCGCNASSGCTGCEGGGFRFASASTSSGGSFFNVCFKAFGLLMLGKP